MTHRKEEVLGLQVPMHNIHGMAVLNHLQEQQHKIRPFYCTDVMSHVQWLTGQQALYHKHHACHTGSYLEHSPVLARTYAPASTTNPSHLQHCAHDVCSITLPVVALG